MCWSKEECFEMGTVDANMSSGCQVFSKVREYDTLTELHRVTQVMLVLDSKLETSNILGVEHLV